MISTILRGSMSSESKVAPAESHRQGVYIYFNEFEVQISKLESKLLNHFSSNGLLLRMLTGTLDRHLSSSISSDHLKQPSSNAFTNMGPPRPVKRAKTSDS